jgi:orotate phosphoribosyltransferase
MWRLHLQDELMSLVRAQSGHFVHESGYHSDVWWDLEALCRRPAALLPYVNALATQVKEYNPDVVCGALVEGAFVALLAACNLHTDFAYALRSGGDPKQLFSVSYYLPNALRGVVKGKRVVIANDVISAGSAVRGAIDDVQQWGGTIVAVASLVALGNTFAEFCRARQLPLISLFRQEFHMWLPNDCPLCAAGGIPDHLAHN